MNNASLPLSQLRLPSELLYTVLELCLLPELVYDSDVDDDSLGDYVPAYYNTVLMLALVNKQFFYIMEALVSKHIGWLRLKGPLAVPMCDGRQELWLPWRGCRKGVGARFV